MRSLKALEIYFLVLSGYSTIAQVPAIDLSHPLQFKMPKVEQPLTENPVVSAPAQHLNTVNPGTSQREQYHYIMAEVENHTKQNSYRDQLIQQADRELEKNVIHYEFDMADGDGTQYYYHAFTEIKRMIEGEVALDLKKAVFLVEQSYDPSLKYEDFEKNIHQAILIVSEKMKSEKFNPQDNTAKVMALFQYMSDTITVYSSSLEKNITSYPKTYDFEDFWGRQDYRKMFVSKAFQTGSGQCHSLPLLFLILCQEIGAEANLAFSPNHSFVKFQDKRGLWHNLELTNGMLASDHFMIQSGYIKAEALQSKIFLEPISMHQTIVQCLNDLALGYVKKYGYDAFVKASTNLALKHFPNSLTAHQINANYFAELSNYIIYQYRNKGWSKEKLEQDKKAMSIINSASGATKHIEKLGYADMPAEAYEAWLKSIKNEVSKQQHLKEARGLNGMIERQ